jgi:transcriptional regulator with XRE-family HTH domain
MKRTPAAVLRAILGIKAFEMAELIGCSPHTINSLETGRMPLSEVIAGRMFNETEISPQWLLEGDPKAPPKSAYGEPYTKAIFDRAQAVKVERDNPSADRLMLDALDCAARLVAIFTSARARKEYYMVSYKARKAIEELGNEFGQDRAIYSPPVAEIHRHPALRVLKKIRDSCAKRGPDIISFGKTAADFRTFEFSLTLAPKARRKEATTTVRRPLPQKG